ncbi:hypothetical protein SPFL3102_01152 [Sporomusaceae bacterium FL31]|nr:hypothetical protein SPFL3101_00239 [Sporomusaceae bacterium FL31]GCE33348.1 hypothetical protein SPFL3102_01152 [Sporomusaceae bacterium]
MLKDYPATQLFLLWLFILVLLLFMTPFLTEWHYFASLLSSLKFIVKVICGFFLVCTLIEIKEILHSRKQKHLH